MSLTSYQTAPPRDKILLITLYLLLSTVSILDDINLKIKATLIVFLNYEKSCFK